MNAGYYISKRVILEVEWKRSFREKDMARKIMTVTLTFCIIFTITVFAEGGSDQNKNIFVEIFLAKERKEDLTAIKKRFSDYGINRVNAQFFRVGSPPPNIAIGSQVSAEIARMAIDLAIQYNHGVTHLLPQFRFFPHQISIGTSAFDELVPVAIRPDDLERLRDPTLSDVQFRTLYRQLTKEKPYEKHS
jgi:hypothetical protein